MKRNFYIIFLLFLASIANSQEELYPNSNATCNGLDSLRKKLDHKYKVGDSSKISDLKQLTNLSCPKAKMYFEFYKGWQSKIDGDLDNGYKHLQKSYIIAKEINDIEGQFSSLDALYFIYYHANDTIEMTRIIFELNNIRTKLDHFLLSDFYEVKTYYYDMLNQTDSAFLTIDSMQMYSKYSNDVTMEFAVFEMRATQFMKVGNTQEAVENQKKFCNGMKELGFVRYYLQGIEGLSQIYSSNLEYEKAISCLTKEIDLVVNSTFTLSKQRIFKQLSELYQKTNNYPNSLKYFKLFHQNEIVVMTNTNFSSVKKEFQLEKEKQEQEALAQFEKLENEKKAIQLTAQKKQKWFLYFSIGTIIIFCLFIVNRLRLAKKQKTTIERQKLEVDKAYIGLEEAHKEITDSINYAERIQKSFLATDEILNENLNEYFVYFNPKEAVSGDFYWAGILNNGDFAMVNADSTGHGVPGAIMSILNISSIEKAVERNATNPADIFNKTRKTIIERLKKDGSPEGGKDGMDASMIAFNSDKSKMTYVAAQNPIWIIREDKLTEIKPEKMPVGKFANDHTPFEGGEFELQKGDQIYTLTDGFQDQFGGPKGKKFMVKKMRQHILSIANLPMTEQNKNISEVFSEWKGDLEQIDDVCVIGVKIS